MFSPFCVLFVVVQSLSRVWLFVTPWIMARPGSPVLHYLQELAQTHCYWVSDAISSSVVPFSSHPQSFPASGSFQMSQLFASGGQSTRVSASTSVLPMNTQDWTPLGWTGWISLQSKGLSRVFSNNIVWKHQFISADPSWWAFLNHFFHVTLARLGICNICFEIWMQIINLTINLYIFKGQFELKP